jgi:hypothetical protein
MAAPPLSVVTLVASSLASELGLCFRVTSTFLPARPYLSDPFWPLTVITRVTTPPGPGSAGSEVIEMLLAATGGGGGGPGAAPIAEPELPGGRAGGGAGACGGGCGVGR